MEAKLSLWAVKNGSFSNGAKSIEKLTKSFDEASVTWNSPWKAAGGDFSGVAASNMSGSLNKWEEFDVTSTIKNIIEEGGSNNGLIVKMKTATSGVSYFSSENSDTEHRPKLEITYHTYETNPPSVKMLKPNGGEIYTSFEIEEISWEANDDDGIASQKLFLTPDNGGTWIEFADIEKDDRSWEFEVPYLISDQYKAKIVAYDMSGNYSTDLSDDFFIVKPDTVNPSDNFVNFASWDPMCDDLGSSYEYGAGASDSVSMKYFKVPKQSSEDPWISLNAYLPSGKSLEGVRWLKIEYKADYNMLMSLYNEDLAMNGENFCTTLPPTSSDSWETAFFYVGNEVFKQPDWVNNTIDLDFKTMSGLSFGADMGYGGAEAHIQIREIVLYNYGNTPISSNNFNKNEIMPSVQSVKNGNVIVYNARNGLTEISILGLNGKTFKQIEFINNSKVMNIKGLTNNLAKGNYLVKLKNGNNSYINSITVK